MNYRGKYALAWAEATFGPVARDRKERAARVVEEAIELAQSVGISKELVEKIASRAFSRPPGEVSQELGGLGLTVEAFAANEKLDLDLAVDVEVSRVVSKPKEFWEAKHAAKVADGTANVTENGK